MKLDTSRRLATLSFLFAGALWMGIGMGCSADPETVAAVPAATPTVTPDEGGEPDESGQPEDEDAGTAADASNPRDAGKKRDASTTSEVDATVPPSDASVTKKDASTTPACNTVPVASVTPVAVTGSSAALTGGTLVDGVYTLVEYKRYIGGTSNTTFPPFSMGVSIQGSTLDLAGSGGRASYTFTASGNELSLTRTCPSAATAAWYYQITGDMLTLYGVPPSNGTWYATFKRQP